MKKGENPTTKREHGSLDGTQQQRREEGTSPIDRFVLWTKVAIRKMVNDDAEFVEFVEAVYSKMSTKDEMKAVEGRILKETADDRRSPFRRLGLASVYVEFLIRLSYVFPLFSMLLCYSRCLVVDILIFCQGPMGRCRSIHRRVSH